MLQPLLASLHKLAQRGLAQPLTQPAALGLGPPPAGADASLPPAQAATTASALTATSRKRPLPA